MGVLRKEHGDRSTHCFGSGDAMFFAVGIQRPDLFIGQVDYRPHSDIVP
jgi:hypothetical protein